MIALEFQYVRSFNNVYIYAKTFGWMSDHFEVVAKQLNSERFTQKTNVNDVCDPAAVRRSKVAILKI